MAADQSDIYLDVAAALGPVLIVEGKVISSVCLCRS